MENRAERVESYRDAVASGLAMGVLKIDHFVVAVGPENPITGEERISRSTLHHEIATAALEIHDQLVATSEDISKVIPHATEVRAHILRVIGEAAHPWDKEE